MEKPTSRSSRGTRLALVVLFALAEITSAAGSSIDFGYSGLHGPSYWPSTFGTCVGKHQSPINIDTHIVINATLQELDFTGLRLPRPLMIQNNGHTAMVKVNGSGTPGIISGGPLSGSYIFEQLHFHWGENDKEGSEDLINNHSFAMELHAVFYKADYPSFSEAVKYPDGLAVLAYFFEADADDKPNPNFTPIVAGLAKIESVDSGVQLPPEFRLSHLLEPEGPPPNRLQNYFTYNGSLTTPPCSEVVTWIDFQDPLHLSHSQIAAFRDIKSSDGGKLTHNYRPVQPHQGRVILRNIPTMERERYQRLLKEEDFPEMDGAAMATSFKENRLADSLQNKQETGNSAGSTNLDFQRICAVLSTLLAALVLFIS